MSRITRIEEERTQKRLIVIAISIVVLLIVVFTVGIPFIVKMASLLADRNASGQTITNGDTTPPLPPTISPILAATNSATLKISGYAEPEATLKLIVDDSEAKKVVLGSDGQFEFNDIKLTLGTNSIKAIAVDGGGNESSPSKVWTILYKKKAPKLDITEPEDGKEFHQKDHAATIKGETDVDTQITINGRFVSVSDEGKFSFVAQLSDGDNTFTIIATDSAGNQTKLERKFKYIP